MSAPQVLVIDELTDTEEVLRAVLAPRGIEVQRITGHEAETSAPAVVIIDGERPAPPRFAGVPQIVLGRITRLDTPGSHVLPKPFHYAELIRAVEDVIDQHLV